MEGCQPAWHFWLRKSKLNTERGSTGGNRFQFQPHQNHKVHAGAASTCGSGLSTPNQFMSWKRGLSKPRRWTDCYWSLVNMSTYINLKSLGADQVSTEFDLQRWQLHATGITFQGFLSEKDGERLWTSDLVLVRWKIQLVPCKQKLGVMHGCAVVFFPWWYEWIWPYSGMGGLGSRRRILAQIGSMVH